MQAKPLIQVRNLSHSFGDGVLRKLILDQISIDFSPGEIAMIMGPSGSGKTTFLTLIGALRAPQAGSIQIGEREFSGSQAEDLIQARRDIGFIFQNHNLIDSVTACQNVQLPLQFDRTETAESSRRKALALLRMVGLQDHAEKTPRQLSGGQRQRVAIARALIRKPKLILADEPTASLDKNTGREVVEIIQRMAREFQCTILIVTHDHRILDIADRVLLLEEGQLEDLDQRLEMLLDRLSNLLAALPEDLERSVANQTLNSRPVLSHFRKDLEELDHQINNLAHLKTRPNLAHKVESLQQMSGQSRLLFESVERFAALLVSTPAPNLASLFDRLFQALHALLFVAVDAFKDRSTEQIAILLQTTADRREVLARLRNTYLEAQTNLSQNEKTLLFDLSTTFEHSIFFLNSLGNLLRRTLTESE